MLKKILNFKEDDWNHIGWLFRNMIKQFILGDFHEAREALYFIQIHLSYNSKRIK
jgi:hypothetical protein